jgi:ubiquinone/menaquinone biosynthesis C-methylase UbiE
MTQTVQRGFDRLAPWYDGLTRLLFGRTLHRSQTGMLDRVEPKQRILLVGGGTGRLLAALCHRFPGVPVDAVDISQQMLQRSRHRLPAAAVENVCFIHFDICQWAPPERYDLIVTPYLLDCLADSTNVAICSRLSRALDEGGHWLLCDFDVPPPSLPMHVPARFLIAGLYLFFRLTCSLAARRLPDFERAFAAASLQKISERRYWGGLMKSRLYGRA